MQTGHAGDAQQALREYLNDETAALFVAEPIGEALLAQPEQVSRSVLSWVDSQVQVGRHTVPVPDLLFHALHKIELLSETGLVEPASHRRAVGRLSNTVATLLPSAEADRLRSRLTRHKEAEARPVQLLHQDEESAPRERNIGTETGTRGGSAGGGSGKRAPLVAGNPARSSGLERDQQAPPAASPRGKRLGEPLDIETDFNRKRWLERRRREHQRRERLRREQASLGLDRFEELNRRLQMITNSSPAEQQKLLIAAAATAADTSQNEATLAAQLDRLQSEGLFNLRTDLLFTHLTARLPDWDVEWTTPPRALQSVARVVRAAGSPEEELDRLREVYRTAARWVSQGALRRAQGVLELGESLLRSSNLSEQEQDEVRAEVERIVDRDQLLELAAEETRHEALRNVLRWLPTYSVWPLLRQLTEEREREVRLALLRLLRAWGSDAREAALSLLRISAARSDEECPWTVTRNLLHLLRRIPLVSEGRRARELHDVRPILDRPMPPALVREAAAYLATLELPAASELLLDLHQRVEKEQADPSIGRRRRRELARTRTLILGQALKHPTSTSRRAVLDVLLASGGVGPAARALFERIGTVSLAGDLESLSRLVEVGHRLIDANPKTDEPRLARTRGAVRIDALASVLRALASTLDPDVDRLLEKAASLADRELQSTILEIRSERGKNAAQAGDAEDFEGSIELFGLPGLLLSLEQNEATGTLELTDESGETQALLQLERGALRRASVGELENETAVYALMQRPLATRFQFISSAPRAQPTGTSRSLASDGLHLGALLLEASRRYDEFQSLRALVGDRSPIRRLETTEPGAHNDRERVLARELWQALGTQPTPAECEEMLAHEPFRIRRLLASWLEQGAVAIDARL